MIFRVVALIIMSSPSYFYIKLFLFANYFSTPFTYCQYRDLPKLIYGKV